MEGLVVSGLSLDPTFVHASVYWTASHHCGTKGLWAKLPCATSRVLRKQGGGAGQGQLPLGLLLGLINWNVF
jgi:hypothetical protein